jgi:succinate dehydrogenase / fumarate reductase iron-sulfur subunit
MTRMPVFTPDEVLTHASAGLPGDPDLVTGPSFDYAKARQIPSFTPIPGRAG